MARGDKHSVCLSVVPSNCELDLKARGEDDRRQEDRHGGPEGGRTADRIHPGGVTALACKKPYVVYLDETAQLFDLISISAGVR